MSESSESQHEPHAPGSHYQPALSVVLIILVLFVAATFLMLRSSGPKNPSAATSSTVTTPSSSTSSTTAAVVPKSQVRVQVANGTSVTGLARTYTQQLMTLGWDALPETNANKVTSTIVYYNPGYKWAAQSIAASIKVGGSAVQPLNGLSPVAGSSGDDVIVILGPDVAIAG